MLTDKAYKKLIQDFTNGDESCIETLYDHYAGSLYGGILKLTQDESLAQDILQETFVRIWKNSNSYDPHIGRLFTWMMRIARNTAINKLQSKGHRNGSNTDGPDKLLYIATENYENESFDLSRIVDNIEDKYSRVLNLVYFQGYTHKEVSDELDLPLGTVKSRVKIGLRHLRNIYDYLAPSVTGSMSLLILTFI